jgi:hypothetical protein
VRKLLAAGGLLLLLTSPGAVGRSVAAAPSFAPARGYATGRIPAAVAIGDLNGDGKRDLATANSGAATVSVLLNRGDGSFRPKRDSATGRTPDSVAVGDLNGDSRPDLVTANEHGESVSVLFGSGDGGFQSRRNYPIVAGESQSVAIGDFNGDQKPDLAAAPGAYETRVSVFLNTGDGTLGPGQGYGIVPADSVVVGDVNGDGSLDLVTASAEEHDFSVYLNRGDGTFDEGGLDPFGAEGTPLAVAIGDLNGDGKLDLAASANTNNAWEGGPTISVYLNRGDGSFRFKTYYLQSEVFSLAIGDLNGDDKPDLATANDNTDSVSVLANAGQGRFQPHVDYRTPNPGFVAIGDLNGDGKPDLAATNYPNAVSVLVNRPGLCTVQDVVGRRLRIARQQIVRGNCRVGKIRRAYSKTVKRGRVISQRPRFGVVLRGGGKVNLVVSRGRKPW